MFHGNGAHPLSWVLKPGFRHVFAAIRSDNCWIVIDSAEGLPFFCATQVDDLAGFYRDQGFTVIGIERREAIRSLAVPSNCVGLVKASVGIRSWAVTPWQLYKHLTRRVR